METKELVKALLCCTGSPRIKDCKERCRYFRGGNMNKCIPDMGKDVASALESMQEELDRVKAERDAAVSDLTDMVNEYRRETSGTDFCGLCEYDLPPAGENGQMAECPGFYRDDCFKWRGLEGRKA